MTQRYAARFGALLLFLLALAIPSRAQMYTITGTIQNSDTTAAGPGQMCFSPTDGNGNAISFRMPGQNAQASTKQVCATADQTGSWSIQLPNVELTQPQRVCFKGFYSDGSGDDEGSPNGLLGTGSSCIQPGSGTYAQNWCNSTNSTCNFNLWTPSIPTVPVMTVTGGTTIIQGGGGISPTPSVSQTVSQPSGTALSVANLSVQNNVLLNSAGTCTLNVFDSSYGTASVGQTPGSLTYMQILANDLQCPTLNAHTIGSTSIADLMSGDALFPFASITIAPGQFNLLGMDSNDISNLNGIGTPAQMMYFTRQLYAWLWYLGVPDSQKIFANNPAVAQTGSWTAGGSPSANSIYTTAPGSTLTASGQCSLCGINVVMPYESANTFTVTIDKGTANEVDVLNPLTGTTTFTDGDGVYQSATGATYDQAMFDAQVPMGYHTVTLTVLGINTHLTVMGFEFIAPGMIPPTTGPFVIKRGDQWGHNATNPPYSPGHTDAIWAQWREIQKAAVTRYTSNGLQALWINGQAPGCYNPNDLSQTIGDYVHPNASIGVYNLANCIAKQVNSAMAPGDRTTKTENGAVTAWGGYWSGGPLGYGLESGVTLLPPFGSSGTSTGFQTGREYFGFDANAWIERTPDANNLHNFQISNSGGGTSWSVVSHGTLSGAPACNVIQTDAGGWSICNYNGTADHMDDVLNIQSPSGVKMVLNNAGKVFFGPVTDGSTGAGATVTIDTAAGNITCTGSCGSGGGGGGSTSYGTPSVSSATSGVSLLTPAGGWSVDDHAFTVLINSTSDTPAGTKFITVNFAEHWFAADGTTYIDASCSATPIAVPAGFGMTYGVGLAAGSSSTPAQIGLYNNQDIPANTAVAVTVHCTASKYAP